MKPDCPPPTFSIRFDMQLLCYKCSGFLKTIRKEKDKFLNLVCKQRSETIRSFTGYEFHGTSSVNKQLSLI